MKKQTEIQENQGNCGRTKWYRDKIAEMISQIEDENFLNQIRIILKKHIEKRG